MYIGMDTKKIDVNRQIREMDGQIGKLKKQMD